MKDMHIPTIQPLGPRHTPDKSGAADKAQGAKFEKELDTAVSRAKEPETYAGQLRKVQQDVDKQGQVIKHLGDSLQSLAVRVKMLTPPNEK